MAHISFLSFVFVFLFHQTIFSQVDERDWSDINTSSVDKLGKLMNLNDTISQEGIILNSPDKPDSLTNRQYANTIRKKKTSAIRYAFISQVGLNNPSRNPDSLLKDLEHIENYKILFKSRRMLEDTIVMTQALKWNSDTIYVGGLKRNLNVLNGHLNDVVSRAFNLYAYTDHKGKFFKSFHAYHDNDVFMIKGNNGDRDYTGGFRLEVTTDQLKLRMFKRLNSDRFLSHQSLLLGGEGYTPYIRFTEEELINQGIQIVHGTNGFPTEESLAEIQEHLRSKQELGDRPFASFQYLARGKYRLHYRGFMRSASHFKVGFVGKNVGKNIQAIIHQDLSFGAQRVLNWGRQIAEGGRFAFNIEHKVDFSLISRNNIFNWRSTSDRISKRINVYTPVEAAIGTVRTHFGTGLGFGTASFLEISTFNDPKYNAMIETRSLSGAKNKWNHLWHSLWNHVHFNCEYRVRRVIHNSMLNGIGFFEKAEDDPLDDEAVTVYSLKEEDIADFLHSLEIGINIRLRNMNVYFKQTRLINEEFKVTSAPLAKNDNFQTRRWYGWGTVGFNIYF